MIFYENMVKLIRMEDKNIHSGHRRRMTERFLKYPDSLSEHEVLEIMLYSALPRKDTNPLAHKLLRTFGSLKNVLSADAEVLKSVDGVGEKTCLSKASFACGLKDEVFIDPKELAQSIIVARPKRAVAIHNHLSGNPSPSKKDDETTEKLYKLLALHGVELSDHVIVAGNRTYSYYYSDRLEEIKQR